MHIVHRSKFGEACRLAGAGLRGAEQIAAREHRGNGLRLDRSGFGITLLADSAEQLGRQAEIRERRANGNLLNRPAKAQPSKPVQADDFMLLDSKIPGRDREQAETLTGKRETETLDRIIR